MSANGLRATKTTTSGTTYYLYDGDGNHVEETDASGNPTALYAAGAQGLVSR